MSSILSTSTTTLLQTVLVYPFPTPYTTTLSSSSTTATATPSFQPISSDHGPAPTQSAASAPQGSADNRKAIVAATLICAALVVSGLAALLMNKYLRNRLCLWRKKDDKEVEDVESENANVNAVSRPVSTGTYLEESPIDPDRYSVDFSHVRVYEGT